jgi:hypothetical protein
MYETDTNINIKWDLQLNVNVIFVKFLHFYRITFKHNLEYKPCNFILYDINNDVIHNYVIYILCRQIATTS